MHSLKSRIRRVETGIDVASLSDEQLKRLSIPRLSLEQIQALPVTRLTDEQFSCLSIKDLTDEQIAAISRRFKDRYPELAAVVDSMTDEELAAVKEWRLWPWHPGYKGE